MRKCEITLVCPRFLLDHGPLEFDGHIHGTGQLLIQGMDFFCALLWTELCPSVHTQKPSPQCDSIRRMGSWGGNWLDEVRRAGPS
jgi:hypothetical protein